MERVALLQRVGARVACASLK